MTDTSKESLVKSIKAILKDADLDQLSAKKIRKILETEYKTDFTDRKNEIDKLVMQLITDNESEGEKEEEKKEQESKQKMTNGSTPASKQPTSPAKKNKGKEEAREDNNDLSNDEDDNGEVDDDDDDSGLDEIEDVVPKKKAKVQTSSKKSKSSKKLNDEELAKQLQDDEGLRPSRRCKAQPVVRKQKKPRKESAKGTSVYSRPCALLPPLDEVMGTDKMPRPMIVKRLWEIVKERDLLDPKNKQFMLCDTEMQGLFGKSRVRMFGAMKLLKPYIKDLPKE
ncbi:uncharacterized protein LOC143302308 [Babylonia areolata]|uniref:uncharacterized protein LOC143302308 n=1 Tax=Babylonia areolata TaxID=304850 RepID=UPI003FD17D6A